MKHVLLLEPKQTEAGPLIEKIESNERYKVSHVTNMREAKKQLEKRPHQLALIPVTRNDSIVYSLRALQADLPIILLADYEDRIVSERQASAVWGIITKAILLDALPQLELLDQNRRQIEKLFWPETSIIKPKSKIDMEKLTQLVQRALINRNLQFVLLTKGAQIIGYHNQVQETQLMAVAEQVNESWDARPRTAQIQYFENSRFNTDGSQSNSLLLFTRPFREYLLTLGALPKASIMELRQASDLISSRMEQAHVEDDEVTTVPASAPKNDMIPRPSYALLCLLRTSLSAAQTTKIEQIFRQISEEHECHLEHLDLTDNYLHIVATCPPYRTGSWLADLFKHESNHLYSSAILSKQELWHDTYYVKASTKPLSQQEIDLFLQLASTPV